MFDRLNEFHGSLICNEDLQRLLQRVLSTGTNDSRRFNNVMVPVPHPLRFISINIAPRRKEVRVRSDRAVCLEAIFFSRGTVTKWSMPRGKRSGVVFPGEEETRGATRCFHMCDDLL